MAFIAFIASTVATADVAALSTRLTDQGCGETAHQDRPVSAMLLPPTFILVLQGGMMRCSTILFSIMYLGVVHAEFHFTTANQGK